LDFFADYHLQIKTYIEILINLHLRELLELTIDKVMSTFSFVDHKNPTKWFSCATNFPHTPKLKIMRSYCQSAVADSSAQKDPGTDCSVAMTDKHEMSILPMDGGERKKLMSSYLENLHICFSQRI
jgi:hypothetical protein